MPVLSGLLLTMAVPQPDRDLAAWMATYGPGLRRYFRRRADDADVDDLVQEVFLRLQSAQLSTPIENVERYLFAAASNALNSRYRRQKPRPTMLPEEFEEANEIAEKRPHEHNV